MGEIQSGNGFSEAITQMGEAANAADAANRKGDKKEVAKQKERFKNAEAAAGEYKKKKYG
ncbi:hypothetical protein [Streptomyces sp. NPDC018055]|uniref:hypothetical protein n=1 Tax=Streptomyces sp. NPDC018055 TaxID=3365038 RepID=UPI0037896A07